MIITLLEKHPSAKEIVNIKIEEYSRSDVLNTLDIYNIIYTINTTYNLEIPL